MRRQINTRDRTLYIIRLPYHIEHTHTHLIIPNLDGTIISARQNVGLVPRRVIVDAIDPTLVTFERVVRNMRTEAPHLDGPIQRGTGKGIGILRVDLDLHDVMRMTLKHLRAIKVAIPVPQFNRHVVTRRQDVGKGWMHFEATNVISVRFKLFDLFHGIVIENAQAHIIGCGQEPLFASYKFGTADGQFRYLERFGQRTSFIIPNHDMTRVQGCQHPWFDGV
jgi:hypothetical protein